MIDYERIPPSLAKTPNWLCFKLTDTGKARLGKPPVSPKTGRICAKNDETEFTTLQDALVGMERYDLDGIGFVFTDGFVAIDLDDCFDESGLLSATAQDIFDHFTETYWEYSPSGNGLHGFMRGVKPNERTKDSALGIEVYSGYNFVTVTGDRVDGTGTDAVTMQEPLDWLYAEYLPPIISPDAEIPPVDHGERTPQEWLSFGLAKDEKLAGLYNSTVHEGDESSIDFALLSKLAFWLNRDADEMESAFHASPWARTKDKAHTKKLDRPDYLPDSTLKAAGMCSTTAQETSEQYETKAIRFFSSKTPTQEESELAPLDDYTDLANAEALASVFNDVLCYTPEWGWCFFEGRRYETGVSFRAMEAARDIAQGLMVSAKQWLSRVQDELEGEGINPDSKDGKDRLKAPIEFYKHALKSQSEHGLTAMVALNKAYMVASADNFDVDPWLLNTPVGVVDLKSGEVMPHDAKYRLTSMTAVAPERIETPTFDAFMDRIFGGDGELIDFVQRVIGSALIGKVYNENLIIANGTGANGKSTLFNTFYSLFGEYATALDPNLLMSSKANEQAVGMAMLQGKRFAVAQETEEGHRLSSSMLKRLVSTDTMVAKKLYKDPHEFTPIHTLVLSTNHLPKISSTDTGTWRRIVVLPFEEVIPPEEMVTDFHSLLIEREGPGILQWAIEGAVKFSEAGCDISEKPSAVKDASHEYRTNEDWLANFLEEHCEMGNPHDEETWIKHSDLYRVYHRWAKESGEYIRSSTAFGKAMLAGGWLTQQKHYDPDTQSTAKVWFGLTLVNDRRFTLTQGEKAT